MVKIELTFKTLADAVRALREIPEDSVAGTQPFPSIVEPAVAEATKLAAQAVTLAAERVAEVAAAPVEKPKARTAAAAPASQATTPAPSSPTAEAAVVTAAPEKTAAASSPTAESAGAAAPASTAAIPDRAVVSKAAVALALKDKPKIIEILGSFSVKAVKELPEDKLADALAAINAALGA